MYFFLYSLDLTFWKHWFFFSMLHECNVQWIATHWMLASSHASLYLCRSAPRGSWCHHSARPAADNSGDIRSVWQILFWKTIQEQCLWNDFLLSCSTFYIWFQSHVICWHEMVNLSASFCFLRLVTSHHFTFFSSKIVVGVLSIYLLVGLLHLGWGVSWGWEHTHTDQCLLFDSQHPLEHKLGMIRAKKRNTQIKGGTNQPVAIPTVS